jgi:hypothetical protein
MTVPSLADVVEAKTPRRGAMFPGSGTTIPRVSLRRLEGRRRNESPARDVHAAYTYTPTGVSNMFIANRAAMLAVSAGLAAVPVVGLQAASVGHPADKQANAIARDASPGQGARLGAQGAPRPAQLQDLDTEI